MEAMAGASGLDHQPVHARCEICGHEHACYVGGSHRLGSDGSVEWERHVCLGCLMRASTPRGFETCTDCFIGPQSSSAGVRDA